MFNNIAVTGCLIMHPFKETGRWTSRGRGRYIPSNPAMGVKNIVGDGDLGFGAAHLRSGARRWPGSSALQFGHAKLHDFMSGAIEVSMAR